MLAALIGLAFTGFVPPLSDMVVYEANLRALGPTGGFTTLTRRLGSIQALGVNVLWLMPVQPVGKLRSAGGIGSPYAVADYDAVNPEFGSSQELRDLINAAHKRKMAVIIDWVANHTAWDNPWVTTHPDWYTKDAKGNITIPGGTNWQDVADLNYDNANLRKAMIASMKGWVKRFDLDGFRCDTADWVPVEFWKQAITSLRAGSGRPLLMLAEGHREDHYAAGFDLTYGWPFYDSMVNIYKGSKATLLAETAAREQKEAPPGAWRLQFSTNHDKDAWDATPLETFKTDEGVRAAFAVTALYGGTPLIYTGQEVAWNQRIPIFYRSTVDWSRDPETAKWMARLFRLRRQHVSLRTGKVKDFSSEDAIVFERQSGLDNALIVANVRDHAVNISIPKAAQGTWADGIAGASEKLGPTFSLPPYQFRVFVRSTPIPN